MGLVSSVSSSLAPAGFSLADITKDIQQYVVSPLAAFGIAGFIFNVQGESTASLRADITDHYAEDNKAIQDQIAIHPKRITLKGYVGELVYNGPGTGQTPIQNLAQKLVTIGAYLPTLTASATQAVEAVTPPITADALLSSASNIYGIVKNVLGAFGDMKNQQNAYNYFAALMNSGTLMGVQTPWAFMTSMAIESIVAVQGEQSDYISDFTVTLKEIRIAKTSTVAFSQLGGGTANATAAPVSPPGSIVMSDLPGANEPVSAAQKSSVALGGQTPGAATDVEPKDLIP